jgi:nicotinamide-nucleotide amidase
MASATIIVIGSEILDGRQLDTNSNWLAKELEQIGLPVSIITACPDDQSAIVHALHLAKDHSNLILLTGGLGPTTDDLTREALADFMGVELVLHDELWEEILSRFEKRGIPCPENNRKQALLPRNAKAIPNGVGSAPGILIESTNQQDEQLLVAAFPGVPRELKQMFSEHLAPMLTKEFALSPKLLLTLYCLGYQSQQ